MITLKKLIYIMNHLFKKLLKFLKNLFILLMKLSEVLALWKKI